MHHNGAAHQAAEF